MAFAIISPDRIELPPGGVVRLPCSWTEYQTLAAQRGDRSIPRIKYRNGEVLLMVPLLEHGKSADVSASVVRTLLDHQRQPYDAFTPITMTLPESGGNELPRRKQRGIRIKKGLIAHLDAVADTRCLAL